MQILLILWVISVLGYVFTVIKEKLYLKNNMIVIENKWLTQEDLDKADIKEFIFNGVKVRFGDEIKIVTNGNDIFKGILIGATKKDGSIVMVTYDNKVKMLDINDIVKFRLISKYGRFF
jgi:beta-lactamase regulating signal transducer with metallopeptidase domain